MHLFKTFKEAKNRLSKPDCKYHKTLPEVELGRIGCSRGANERVNGWGRCPKLFLSLRNNLTHKRTHLRSRFGSEPPRVAV